MGILSLDHVGQEIVKFGCVEGSELIAGAWMILELQVF